jgi:hypothetical protein
MTVRHVAPNMDPYHQFSDPRCILVSLPDDGPMRPKHVAGNKYSIVKYLLIIDHFVVETANLTIYVWDTQQDAHCEDNIQPVHIIYLIITDR